MKLTANFSMSEFTKSDTARANNITEQYTPSTTVINNLLLLATNVLQPIRNHIVKIYPQALISLSLTSGYRCERLEKILTWRNFLRWADRKHLDAGNPETWTAYFVRKHHPKGMAGDVVLNHNQRIRNDLLYSAVMDIIPTLKFTQIIFERGEDGDPKWIHISYDKNDIRNQVFRIK